MNLALINPKVWLEIAVIATLAASGWYAYTWIWDRGADYTQRKWDAVERERADASAKAASDALRITKDLQVSADKDKETKDAQIKTLNASLSTAIAGLSNRTPRPDASGVSSHTPAGAGCTGAELYKPDAEFLTREAARADTLQVELNACYVRYRAVRDALKSP